MTKMTPEQLAKVWRREHGEEAFRAKHGSSREDWIEQEVRNGTGRKEAAKSSRLIMAKLRDEDAKERDEAAGRWNDALRWLQRANES